MLIFRLYSVLGYLQQVEMHTFITFSRDVCAENAERMVHKIISLLLSELEREILNLTVNEVIQRTRLDILNGIVRS